jgi:membrane-associated phospholipid phosphatase
MSRIAPWLLALALGICSSVARAEEQEKVDAADPPPTTLAAAGLPAYELNLAADLPLLAVGGLVMVGWVLDLEPAACAPACDPDDVNGFDRPAAGNWDLGWKYSSDALLGAIGLGTILTLLIDEGGKNGLGDLVVVLESFAAANALSIIFATATRRPRPLVYGDEAPLAERRRYFNSLSFFSGHTAGSFALTWSLFSTIHRRKPDSPLSWVVLAFGVAASSMVAVGRVMSGKHFPSDVLVGAGVGTAFGLAIPALHDRPELPVQVAFHGNGVGLSYRW